MRLYCCEYTYITELNKYFYLVFNKPPFLVQPSYLHVQRQRVREAPSNGYPMIHACIGYLHDATSATIITAQDCIAMQCVKPRDNMQERERQREGEEMHKYHPAHLLAVSVSLPGRGRAH